MATLVVFEPGFALIAETRVPISNVGTRGEIQIGSANGPVVRPLSYGERTRLVIRTAGSPQAVESVSAAILSAALVQPGDADRLTAEILALALAGAEAEAPPFVETTLTVARAEGWDMRQINEAEAYEIDRLAIYLGGAAAFEPDDGWNRIVFVDAARPTSFEDVRRCLAERLITRADVSPAQAAPPQPEARELNPQAVPFEAPGPVRPDGPHFLPPRLRQREAVDNALAPTPEFNAKPGNLGAGLEASHSSQELRSPGAITPAPDVSITNEQDFSASSDEETRPQATPERTRGVSNAAERRPVNRVSYHPNGQAARLERGYSSPAAQAVGGARLRHDNTSAAAQAHSEHNNTSAAARAVGVRREARSIGRARPLAGARAASAAKPLPPEVITLDPSVLGAWGDTQPDFALVAPRGDQQTSAAQAAETMTTLAQIEQLVADEVADALAALLDHEADLRGIDP